MFVASDVVDEETSEDGSTHRIERRCALDVDAPRLLKRVNYRSDRQLLWITSAVHCGYCDFYQFILHLFFWLNFSVSHVSLVSWIMCWCASGLQIAGVDYVYFSQKNTLNRKERTLHIESHNETFSNRVIIHEICCYSVSSIHPSTV